MFTATRSLDILFIWILYFQSNENRLKNDANVFRSITIYTDDKPGQSVTVQFLLCISNLVKRGLMLFSFSVEDIRSGLA